MYKILLSVSATSEEQSVQKKLFTNIHWTHMADINYEIEDAAQEKDVEASYRSCASTPEDELPDDSRYLLDIDINTLRKRSVEEQENYVYVAKAAIRAGQRTHAGRASRRRSKNRRVSTRQKLGIDEVETQLRQTRTPFSQSERERCSLLGASTFFRSRPHPSSTIANQGSNKRLRKPDWHGVLVAQQTWFCYGLLVLLVLMVTLLISSRQFAEVRISLSRLVAALLCV